MSSPEGEANGSYDSLKNACLVPVAFRLEYTHLLLRCPGGSFQHIAIVPTTMTHFDMLLVNQLPPR